MDRSFIIEAQCKEGEALKEVVAVLFVNSEPRKTFLGDLGLANIRSIAEVRPLSKQPTEPTLYLIWQDSGMMSITRFGWDGLARCSEKIHGSPADLVPPVSGPAADSLIYVPSAFVISGTVREDGRSTKPVVGVLVSRPEPGKGRIRPDKKTLNSLGFQTINSVDPAGKVGGEERSALYLFDRVPAPSSVTMITLDAGGVRASEHVLRGEPSDILPRLSGPAAERHIYSRGSGQKDSPKRLPPAGAPAHDTKRRIS